MQTHLSRPFRPIELKPGALEFFELPSLARDLASQDEYARSGVSAITLTRDDHVTSLLVALRRGSVMREHQAPSAGTVVVLRGRVRFAAGAGSPATELEPGGLAAFAADVSHSVEALEDAAYLVVIGGRERHVERAPETLTELLSAEHHRLGAILTEVKRIAASGDRRRAATLFAEFRDGLEHHMAAEEEILFPAFEKLVGSSGPPTVMRAEHAEMRALMAELSDGLESGGEEGSTSRLAALTARLLAHDGKEERILYPATDRAAGEAGALEALMHRIEAF